MNAGTTLLERLVRESFELRMETHPLIKRIVLRSACQALRQLTPETYHMKCHAASLTMHQLLQKLGIRTTYCCGTVKWQFGGILTDGTPWHEEAGFWKINPELPAPHSWLMTEFGGLIDLTCSYFHLTYGAKLQACQSHDVIPTIWMKSDNLSQLSGVKYTLTARYAQADLSRCDDLARQLVAATEVNFDEAIRNLTAEAEHLQAFEGEILDGWQSLERLRKTNSWVIRNSVAPKTPFHGLLRPPV